MNDDELKIAAIHESGHCVFANIRGVRVLFVSIKKDPFVFFDPRDIFKIIFNDETKIIVNLAGEETQKFYYPSSKIKCRGDQDSLFLISRIKMGYYRKYFQQQLQKPEVRNQVEALSSALLRCKCLDGQQIQEILNHAKA